MTLTNLILPFKNKDVKIVQGFNGEYTHKRLTEFVDQSFSVDFALPIGTPVYAAHDGLVVISDMSVDEFYTGLDFKVGKNFIANFIVMNHGSGIFSCYQHFGKDKIFINKHDEVKKGQLLGFTGKSGWIGPQPHLHFSVYRRSIDHYPLRIDTQSIPFRFKNYDGPLEDKEIKKLCDNYCRF
ncbi:M23 family metallopeptidase [Candidatus Woesearchaeota archaeon]|nr:M23 family metallopeptidase [Candidatus Woesearchaeota archaeon]